MAKRSISPNNELTHEEIAFVAYSIFEKSGRIPGRDTENWLQAEAQLRQERNHTTQENASRGGGKASSRVLLNRGT